MKFYDTPAAIKQWGETEEAPHVQWGDLFFDLIFVGVAFTVGHMLEHTGVSAWGVFDSMMVFLILIGAWHSKLSLTARFDVNDMVHKFAELLEFCFVALIAVHIGSLHSHDEDVATANIQGFCVGLFLHKVLYILKWSEISFFATAANERSFSQFQLVLKALTVCIDAWAIQESRKKSNVHWVLVLCYASFLLEQLIMFGRIVFQIKLSRECIVPLHITYLTHRVGELIMLMIGEGVLSLTLASVNHEILWSFYVSFIAGVLLTCCLMFTEYSTAEFHADRHVLRRSGTLGVSWMHIKYIQAFIFVAFGVGLRMLLQRYLHTAPPFPVICLFSFSLATHTVLRQTVEWMQMGERWSNWKMLLCRFLTTVALLVLPFMADNLKAMGMTGCHMLCFGLLFVILHSLTEAFDPNIGPIEGRFHTHHALIKLHAVSALKKGKSKQH